MPHILMDSGELTVDGLIDTGALSSAIPQADLKQLRLLAPQSIVKEELLQFSKSWSHTDN